MIDRDLDDPRNVVREYDELDKDIEEAFDKDIDVEVLEKDGTDRELWKEMDDETKDAFKRLDRDEQKEILEEIKAGRMSLQEARQVMDRKAN